MLIAPRGTPSASSSTRACASCKREELQTTSAGIVSTACTSSTSYVDSPITSVSWGTAINYKELEGTVVRSSMLAAEGAARGKCGGVTRHVADRQIIGDVEVQLLPHPNITY
jgi:hypothetical protein